VEPCGAHGQHPSCEATCPDGRECLPYRGKFNSSCGCSDLPCEEGGLGCPLGAECMVVPGFARACIVIFCGDGNFPSCGGSCGEGWECKPLRALEGEFEICACSLEGALCEAGTGGLGCPPSHVCGADDSFEVRACEPL
jgi:hypothetical protein